MVMTRKFSQFNDAGNLDNNSITVGINAGDNAFFANPWTFLAPGNTASRPAPSTDIAFRLRFNTDLGLYEYYDNVGMMWVQLGIATGGNVNFGLINQLGFYAATGNVISGLTTANNSVLSTNGSGAPSLSTTLPSGLSATNIDLTTPILGVASATSLNFGASTTNGIIGVTTNNNASSGVIGELIFSTILNASAVTFTSTIGRDLTSISLTPGDWDVYANILYTGTSIAEGVCWINSASATQPDNAFVSVIIPVATSNALSLNAPFFRASLATPTIIYVSGFVNGTGTLKGCGGIYARRRR